MRQANFEGWEFELLMHGAAELSTHAQVLSQPLTRAIMGGMRGGGLQEPDELINGHTCLLDNAGERSSLQVFIVIGNRHAEGWLFRMLEDVVASRGVMHTKAPSLEGLQYPPRSERRQSLAHTPCRTTLTFSFTGWSLSSLSCGIGSPSFCKLSR